MKSNQTSTSVIVYLSFIYCMYVLIDICMSYINCLINIEINNLHFCELVTFSEI